MNTQATSYRNARTRRVLIDLTIMTVIGIVLALIGPFGSFQDPLSTRLVVWLGFAYIGYAVYSPIDGLAKRMAQPLDLPVWALQIAGVFVSSIPMAAAVYILPRLPDHVVMPSLPEAMLQYFYVLTIGGIITLIFAIMQRGSTNNAPAMPVAESQGDAALIRESGPPIPKQTSFLDRLPPELGSELIALEMEDHYVRAHTALGSELVLMRLRDAVAELGTLDGAQVHRSWWVARGAVSDVKRDGRNIRLVLENGLEAPVSRANVTPLKDAGWF